MRAPYTVVAFHTPEYSDCVPGFVTCCRQFGLRCEIEPMNSVFDYALNTAQKPIALMRLRARLGGPLLYLDIDTGIAGVPPLPPGAWDMATAQNPVAAHKNRVNCAAFFLADTVGAERILARWAALVRENPGLDHPQLTRTLVELAGSCGPSVPVPHTSPGRREMLARVARRGAPLVTIAAADFMGCLVINALRPERTQANA